MSTRAQICIKRDTPGFKETGGIYIYKHSDGYPEGVTPVLTDIVSRFHKNRGDDACYLLCQIVRAFAAVERDKALASQARGDRWGVPKPGERFGYSEYTGWGLDTVEHDDIEYLYEVDSATGKIYVNGSLLRKRKALALAETPA